MRYIKEFIGSSQQDFLELIVYDKEDEYELHKYLYEKSIFVPVDMLRYLKFFPNAENLIISSGMPDENGFEYLYKLPIIALKISYENDDGDSDWRIDISRFEKLEYLFSRSQKNCANISKCRSLKTAVIFNWYDGDLSELAGASIDSLSITGGKLHSLSGIEKIKGLRALSLSYLPSLTDISALAQVDNLEYLELDACNKIIQIPHLGKLEALIWEGSNRIESLNPSSLPCIRRILLDINIKNGNLNWLNELEHACLLTDKRHYSVRDKLLSKAAAPFKLNGIADYRSICIPLCKQK
ncbi:MAG: hypothetical protein IJL87_04600 [Clostridia bacterium]|nr:hypothetical protein [Clostridia bacterium]